METQNQQLPEGITITGNINDQHEPATLYLFHPLTDEEADDFRAELERLPARERKPAAAMIDATKKAGGRFYWLHERGEWHRVELGSFMFACAASGRQVTVQHNFPMGMDRMEWVRRRAALAR